MENGKELELGGPYSIVDPPNCGTTTARNMPARPGQTKAQHAESQVKEGTRMHCAGRSPERRRTKFGSRSLKRNMRLEESRLRSGGDGTQQTGAPSAFAGSVGQVRDLIALRCEIST